MRTLIRGASRPRAPDARSGRWQPWLPFLVIAWAAAAPAHAQAPAYPVRDINRVPAIFGSDPSQFVQLGTTTFFAASTPQTGFELWKTDGTEAGTVLVKDIWPGSQDSFPTSLVEVNGTLLFAADDGVTGFELWKSDGTEAGTVPVKDIRPGPGGSSPLSLVDVNGTLFFVAESTDDLGSELWKSDGTAAGTVLVIDIFPASTGSTPRSLTRVNGTLFFTALGELWKSDAAGTVRVKDIRPGLDGSSPASLVDVSGTLFFTADDGVSGRELWKSDGTEAGTVRVKDVRPTSLGSDPLSFKPSGSLVFFAAQAAEKGYELWAVPKSALFDADSDEVVDTLDNCPATPNRDQADLDGDGAGDACDTDRDGDALLDAADLCPESPLDQPVNGEGCTAEESVALRCPREDFARHGHYVSCVAQAANEAVREGLIQPAERARLVTRAAREK